MKNDFGPYNAFVPKNVVDKTNNTFMNASQQRPASIGIVMLETRFPRPPGDVGNRETWPFPVRYKTVPGSTPDAIVRRNPEAFRQRFLDAACQLVLEGVAGIVLCCGFLSLFQREAADATGVPVVSSPLLQLPLVETTLPPGKRAGILTISGSSLTSNHLSAAGVSPETPMESTEGGSAFTRSILDDHPFLDYCAAEQELIDAARRLATRHPDVAALVLECTNMGPYAAAIRRETGLPVASPYAVICWFQELLSPAEFSFEYEACTGKSSQQYAG